MWVYCTRAARLVELVGIRVLGNDECTRVVAPTSRYLKVYAVAVCQVYVASVSSRNKGPIGSYILRTRAAFVPY